MNLSWGNTDKARLLSCWLSLTWVITLCSNWVFKTFLYHPLKYWLEHWYVNLSLGHTDFTVVVFHLTWHELFPFVQIEFFGLFSIVLRYIDLKFCIWIYLEVIQIKVDFFAFYLVWHDHELLPYVQIGLSGLFSVVLRDWKFGIWICLKVTFVAFDLAWHELFPFVQNCFSGFYASLSSLPRA